MTSPDFDSEDVFDIRNFQRIVELMADHEINEIDLRRAEQRLRLRRGFPATVQAAPIVQSVAPSIASQGASAPQGTSAPPATGSSSASEEDQFVYITAPVLGTFYSAPNPEAPDYVKVGDHVGPDTVVCILEAMKVFNEIKAEVSGKIVATLAKTGEPADYQQKLFKVDPNG